MNKRTSLGLDLAEIANALIWASFIEEKQKLC